MASEQAMISAALSSAKCYVKVQVNEAGDANKTCISKGPKNTHVCYENQDEAESACWTSKSRNNEEVRLLGSDRLRNYGLDGTSVIQGSYDHYQRSHYQSKQQIANIKQEELQDIQNGLSNIALPVCRSTQVIFSDWDKRGRKSSGLNRHRQTFPCTCGDWRSNEPRPFLDAIGMREGSINGDIELNKAKETFEKICPRVGVGYISFF